MSNYSANNAENILKNVEACIKELEEASREDCFGYDYRRMQRKGWADNSKVFTMLAVYEELSIFDWWVSRLSMSQLEQMRSFLKNAIKLGYSGYVCFKVGAAGCAHGMWAHKLESTDGYSPNEGGCLFHSFRSGDNYYSIQFEDGTWDFGDHSLAEVKSILRERGEL